MDNSGSIPISPNSSRKALKDDTTEETLPGTGWEGREEEKEGESCFMKEEGRSSGGEMGGFGEIYILSFLGCTNVCLCLQL